MNQEPEHFVLNRPSHAPLDIALAFTGTLLLGLLIFFSFQNQQLKTELAQFKSPPANQTTTLPSPSTSVVNDPMANWKTYKSSFWNIELKYPPELNFANTKVLEQEVLRFENDNGYMQIENACALEPQENQESTVSLLGSVFPRYRSLKSGEFNQLYLRTKELKATDKRCMYIIFGLKPDFEKGEKLLFDQILSTFRFVE